MVAELVKAVHFRLSGRLLKLLDETAAEGHRKRSEQIRKYVIEGLRRDGKLDAKGDV